METSQLNMRQEIIDNASVQPQNARIVEDGDYTANRFIVYLDIMGFKDRIARSSHKDVLKTLQEFTNLILDLKKQDKYKSIKQTQFSDSIILFSNGETLDDLRCASEMARDIMRKAIENQIPIRGAIAFGQLTVILGKQLFFGQPLVDAYELEEKGIKYYGVLVHSSAESKVKGLLVDYPQLYRDILAPLKYGTIRHYELNWYFEENQRNIDALNKIRESVSGEPRVYIDNTIKVLNQ